MSNKIIPDIYTVVLNGEPKFRINPNLVKKQGVEDKVADIVALHVKKLEIFEEMKSLEVNNLTIPKLKELNIKAIYIEKELQYIWKFPYNEKFFKFWDTPHCSCPRMDNIDNYPKGPYFNSTNCPIHS